jgi:hypothetical protein
MIYLAVDFKSTLTKIGFSENPQYREKQLQTGNPDLKIFFIFLGGKELEKQLQLRYHEYHYNLEWFSLPKNVINDIITEFQPVSTFFDTKALDSLDFIPQKYTLELTEMECALIEILDSPVQEYDIKCLAKNLFIAEQDIIKLLNQLKKKKVLKYTKKGYKISISVNQAGCDSA